MGITRAALPDAPCWVALVSNGDAVRVRSGVSTSDCCTVSLRCLVCGARGLRAGNASERCADRHANAGRIALTKHVAGHHFPRDEQVLARLAAEVNLRPVVGFQTEVGERDAWAQRIAVERRRVDPACPVRLGWREALGVAVVERGVVEGADPTGVFGSPN